MPITRRRVTSAADMKALAHPVRLDVLELLIVNGPMTASDAAVQLDQTPANVSWHLRKLAEHGFVRQATSGPGRRRPWKVVAESLSWSDDAEDEASASALRDVALEREVQKLRVALANAGQESAAWREVTQVHQSRLWLTPDEAHEIGEQIRQLFLTKAEERQDPANRPADARVMALMAWVVPNGPADGTGRSRGGSHRRGGRVVKAAFGQPGFRLLFAGQLASMIGDSLMLIVLAIWVKDLTGSNGAAGLTFFFLAIPALVAPLFGMFVDRFKRRTLAVLGQPRLRAGRCAAAPRARPRRRLDRVRRRVPLRHLVHRAARRSVRTAQGDAPRRAARRRQRLAVHQQGGAAAGRAPDRGRAVHRRSAAAAWPWSTRLPS